ncbi:MAG: hypothetical protein ACKPKO_65675, partial [Candidatus Fonsibacter sp.]
MSEGAAPVDNMILGKVLVGPGSYQGLDKGERVVWVRFWALINMNAPGSANSVSNGDTMSDKEVLATLSGFQYQESQGTFLCGLVEVRHVRPLALHYPPVHQDQGHLAQ